MSIEGPGLLGDTAFRLPPKGLYKNIEDNCRDDNDFHWDDDDYGDEEDDDDSNHDKEEVEEQNDDHRNDDDDDDDSNDDDDDDDNNNTTIDLIDKLKRMIMNIFFCTSSNVALVGFYFFSLGPHIRYP